MIPFENIKSSFKRHDTDILYDNFQKKYYIYTYSKFNPKKMDIHSINVIRYDFTVHIQQHKIKVPSFTYTNIFFASLKSAYKGK